MLRSNLPAILRLALGAVWCIWLTPMATSLAWTPQSGSRESVEETNGYQPLGGEFHEGSDVPAWRNRVDDMFRGLFPGQ